MADTATKLPIKTDEKTLTARDQGWFPFENLRREVDRLFDDFTPAFWHRPFGRLSQAKSFSIITAPAVDVIEKENAYEITAELPGIDAKNVDVKLSNSTLSIKGEKEETKEEKEKEYFLSERRFGSFQRNFQLPEGIDAAKIEASFANGVLTVVLPKTAEARKGERKIAIKAS
ncbi:Hsp20/alpha crystallin family protein [Rhizobium sp. P40RR-XXII]|uniref:Hsp20/alpha crystallin family protein n=1 Tax=Rhizobium sp. P40RR-XXII TaxID=2726739 RepID=UPI0014565121|nr:Hsp20/alpha crystallin family protein [Rhizobium sp. P40RR-XXII]NLS20407.1 Hsp20/alpha crystallin family protein [Rhizobium sp. P40RR-XXII]